ncbi:MAG: DUF1353 domain-containing protein [Fibromonadales bacterium]|nr:DUF1353 domain-containing protein [Fibromonadales bacterium]
MLRYALRSGFLTNMRSGSHAIDWAIPKFTENKKYNWALIIHDANYTWDRFGGHHLSRLAADQLLREMARVSKTLNVVQRLLMYNALRVFGGSAYDEPNTGVYAGAENYMDFSWGAK